MIDATDPAQGSLMDTKAVNHPAATARTDQGGGSSGQCHRVIFRYRWSFVGFPFVRGHYRRKGLRYALEDYPTTRYTMRHRGALYPEDSRS